MSRGIDAQLHRGNANARPIAVWMNPLHWPERFLQTPGPMEAKARLRGHQRADGWASSPAPCGARCRVQEARMALVNICGGTAARDRAGEAVRTAAVPARAVIGGTGCTAPQQAGAPGPPERTHASGGLGVSRDRRARREHSCASRPEVHPPSKKHLRTAAVRTGEAGRWNSGFGRTSRRKRG